MFALIKYSVLTLIAAIVLAMAVGVGGLYYLIAMVPSPEIEEAAINEILGRESPVFYRDGQTKIGVLFEGIHRQYLPYEAIPKDFVNALTAAEDDQFFHHFGIDVPGIIRAMLVNLKAGKVVQGGSTITQQTAKNLFKRESRSLKAKIKEFLYALRLEHRYSKEKIFEFYTNQFFVSGNGHGLGVAARYFFDKEPKDLSLLECAFIAGSVKRPNYYNPFLKKNLAEASEVRRREEERVQYVLGQMHKLGMLSDAQFQGLRPSDLVFRQGRMSYSQNTAMDLVREGVSTPFIADTLEQNGIANISTSGARIITSLDATLQDKTLLALRQHLSQLDVRLRGYQRGDVQSEYREHGYPGDDEYSRDNFVFGTVAAISDTRERGPELKIRFEDVRYAGVIDGPGLEAIATAYAKYSRGAGGATAADRKALVKQIQPGDAVYVRIREASEPDKLRLDLERYPEVEGGAFVLQEGAVRAMAGGMSNINFNRATAAKRLMGSTFKPFLFGAALQLGWSPVDLLNNRLDTFVLQERPYTPQPDHHSPFGSVTMSWAGVTSENVAAVWLLYHLTDHLTLPMIRELATQLDMAPRVEHGRPEDSRRYRERMRDRYGIVLARQYLDYAAFSAAVRTLEPDFSFDDRVEEYQQLAKMRYDDFQSMRRLAQAVADFRRDLASSPQQTNVDTAFDNPGAYIPPSSTGQMARDGSGRFIFTLRQDLPQQWTAVGRQELIDFLVGLPSSELDGFWSTRVLLDGRISAATMQQVEGQIPKERGKLGTDQLYSVDVLAEVRDFRIMLGMQYMVRLAKECGVNSNFEAVLSMPLGSNVVSLSEMTRLYETLVTGYRHDSADAPTLALAELDGRLDRDAAAIIERIETPDGKVVYAKQVVKTQVFDPRVSAAVANILQNVIPYGTGRYAMDHVELRSPDPERNAMLAKVRQSYPLLGKTGTANDYRNAAFMGYVPVLSQDQSGVSLQGGYTVGVYTGFDDNAPMAKRGLRVSGAVGALPAWSAIAQGILDGERIGDRIDPVDLTFNGLSLQYPEVQQVFLPVAPHQGGAPTGAPPLRQNTPPATPASLCYGTGNGRGRFEPERFFVPYWKNR